MWFNLSFVVSWSEVSLGVKAGFLLWLHIPFLVLKIILLLRNVFWGVTLRRALYDHRTPAHFCAGAQARQSNNKRCQGVRTVMTKETPISESSILFSLWRQILFMFSNFQMLFECLVLSTDSICLEGKQILLFLSLSIFSLSISFSVCFFLYRQTQTP